MVSVASHETPKIKGNYRVATIGVLDDIMISDSFRGRYSVYNSPFPEISVPGRLELVGAHYPIRKIMESGLQVYFPGFDGQFLDLPKIDDPLEFLKDIDEVLVDLAVKALTSYHATRMERDIPEVARGVIGQAWYLSEDSHHRTYQNLPFDAEFGEELRRFLARRGNDWSKLKLEERIIHEIVWKIQQGFRVGERVRI